MFTTFQGGASGQWQVISLNPVIGETLPPAARLSITRDNQLRSATAAPWTLTGFASNLRYVERPEKIQLSTIQLPLGREGATRAALIPIRKTAAWWDMTQDERRAVFEAQSHHIADSLKYLPIIARQLYHSRDLGQPFDFLTWFEYPPEYSAEFESLVRHLRATPEWSYVDREVDIRLAMD